MQKEVVYKTQLKNINKEFLSKVPSKIKKTHLKTKLKSNGENVFLIYFDYKDKEQAFEKFHYDVDTLILSQENKTDQVYLMLNTPGGSVTAYADAAQQIVRLKDAGFKVTCFIDEIAASGGYMMASVCDEIIAQPFAFVGSIGVVAQMPIVEDFLSKYGIQFKVFTAGTKKRSVIPTKKPSEEEENHFKSKLEDIHIAFKNHVLKYRSKIDSEKLMDGDYYMAQDVVKDLMVDSLGDSRSAIIKAFNEGYNLIEVSTSTKKKSSGIASLLGLESVLENIFTKQIDKLIQSASPNELFK
jgi:serine protease SohB